MTTSESLPVSISSQIQSLPTTGGNFRETTVSRIVKLQRVLRTVVGFKLGATLKIRELQSKFGINFQTAWQLSQILNADDPLDGCPHIPRPAAMKKLVATFRRIHATGDYVRAVEEAYEDFERHVAHYASDRTVFDAMTAQLIGGDAESQLELEHRRAVFEAHRFIKGVSRESTVAAKIMHPSREMPDTVDKVWIYSDRNLSRLRSEKPIIVRNVQLESGEAGAGKLDPPRPLDPVAAERFGIPLLPTFCSTAEPPLKNHKTPLGIATEWQSTTVGQPSVIDFAVGEYALNRPLNAMNSIHSTIAFSLPIKLFVYDLLLHRDIFPELQFTTTRWSCPPKFLRSVPTNTEEAFEAAGYERLVCREQLTYIGIGGTSARVEEVPSYTLMLQDACARMKWNLEDFVVYRLRIDYPLLPSMYHTRCALRQSADDDAT